MAERWLPGHPPSTEAEGEEVRGMVAQGHWGMAQIDLVDLAEHLVNVNI